MRYLKIDAQSLIVVNAEIWEAEPSAEGFLYIPSEQAGPGGIGWSWDGEALSPPPAPALEVRKAELTAAVNAERDRRIRTPFSFAGHLFDYDDQSQKRITGAAALAGFALTLGGKLPGDLLWHGGDTPFTWIAADNSLVELDAPGCFALGQAAAAWESAHIFAAKALKNAIEDADEGDLDDIDIMTGWPA